jgi:PAS domain S-box-containing protein
MKHKISSGLLTLGMLLGGCLIIVCILITFRSVRTLRTSVFWVEHTQEVLTEINLLSSSIKDIQVNAREYIPTGNETFLRIISQRERTIHSQIEALKKLTLDNLTQQQRIDSIIILSSAQLTFTRFYSDLRKERGFSAILAMPDFIKSRQFEEKILRLTNHLQQEEQRLLLVRKNDNEKSIAEYDLILYSLLAVLIILSALIYRSIRHNSRLQQITDRKRAEEIKMLNEVLQDQVKSKTVELTSIFERITDGFIMLDKDFNCTYANRRIGEMTGRDAGSILGKYIWDVFPEAIGSDTYTFFYKAFNEQRYQFHVDYNPEFDLWQENYIYPSADGLSVFVRDITLQKRAEEKLIKSEKLYKTVVSHVPGSLICLLDTDRRYFMIEGDLLSKLGYQKKDLLGKKMEEAAPERYAEMVPFFNRVFQGDFFSIDSSQGGFDYSTRFVPIKDENDKVYAAMLLMIDVTELKKAERNITELNTGLELKIGKRTRQLADANKELKAFSYSVAHDLRTPLRAVAGYSNMLAEDYGTQFDAEGRRLLGELQFNNKKMSNLIDDLLTFSRMGRKSLKKSEVDMKLLIVSAWSEIPANSAKLILHELHPVICDTALMKHVMINLLSNAVKYSSKNKGAVIEISSERKEGMIIYSICDNGVGFDMAYASQLFGVFQRLHSDEEFDGTGVGLAIVQRIINRHGGKVWAHSEINKGATFFFSLPEVVLPELSPELEDELSVII